MPAALEYPSPERADTPAPDEFRQRLEQHLTQIFDAVEGDARALAPETLPVVQQVRKLTLRGGKRMRALFVIAGAECTSSSRAHADPLLGVCAAIELLQTYLLIHDDWMDGDTIRRGGPTAHVALTKLLGNAHLGEATAILAGDLASAMAQEALCAPSVPPSRLSSLFRVYTTLQREVMLGQTLDLLNSADLDTVNSLKTGSYTIRGPLSLGHTIADGSSDTWRALALYAAPLGIAFQLRDDLQGAFADVAETGKGPLTDLEKGKRTLVFKRALERLSPMDELSLRSLAGIKGDKARERGRQLLERAGVKSAIETEIATLHAQARAALDGVPLRPPGKTMLLDLAAQVTVPTKHVVTSTMPAKPPAA